MRWKTESVDGSPRLAYDIMGQGPTVLFLHGIGGNRTNWHDQLPAFAAAGFRAVAWDARGYGASEDYEGALRFEDFAADVERLLEHLRVRKVHCCGLSMGGRILLDFFPNYRHRVASLVLCDTFAAFDASFTPQKRAEFVRLRKQPLLEGKSPREMAPNVAKTLLRPNAQASHYERLVESMAALHKDSYIKTIEATTLYDRAASVERIDVPTLLVYGEHDTLTPPAIGSALQEKIVDSEFEIIKDAGHLVNIEQPDAFNRRVLAFLEVHRDLAG